MERIRLGATGIEASRLCFGTMTFANPADEQTSFALLDLAVERGIDHFDTANMYSAGRAEEILGIWLKARGNREDLLIASKVRYPVGGDRKTAGLHPKVLHRELDNTLKRLGTDYLDLYYLHQPDDRTPIETTLRCLQSLVDSGKVRCLGLSNFAAWQVVEALNLCDRHGWTKPLVTQPMYNLVSRGIETEFLPMARHYDLATCVYNPLAGGLLTGKYETDAEESGGRLKENDYYRRRYWHPELIEAARELFDLAKQGGRTPTELALRFLLDSPDVSSILIGARNVDQLTENLSAFEAPPLSEDEEAECDRIWLDLVGPIPRYCRTDEDAKT